MKDILKTLKRADKHRQELKRWRPPLGDEIDYVMARCIVHVADTGYPVDRYRDAGVVAELRNRGWLVYNGLEYAFQLTPKAVHHLDGLRVMAAMDSDELDPDQ